MPPKTVEETGSLSDKDHWKSPKKEPVSKYLPPKYYENRSFQDTDFIYPGLTMASGTQFMNGLIPDFHKVCCKRPLPHPKRIPAQKMRPYPYELYILFRFNNG